MAKANKDTSKTLSDNLFPVVGVGASAGGLDAFKRFIKAIPEHSGMAYVFVQHLHPDHNSILSEILQRETRLPVQEIENNLKVQPDFIYIIPANKILVANDGVLQLSPRPSKDQKNMPIDVFFASLAEVHQNSSIGIVLSGTGTDGTAGLKKIKDFGGITFAQLPQSAAYDAMPQHAIDTELIDFVMEPEKMPQQLVSLRQTFSMLKPDGEAAHAELNDEENFRAIIGLLKMNQKIDFTYYKQTTIRRRILRRLGILKLGKISDYLDHLKSNKPEQELLLQDLLIPVTNFFRDTKTFDNLCEQVFPRLIINKGANKNLRIWVAGCSTGEEAYSMAICLQEYINTSGTALQVQIFATDISEKAVTKARSGQYLKAETEGISEERLQEFFIKIDGTYQVKKFIRDMCVFAVHNFLKDPPFARINLVSCRNVLIYMEPFIQKRAMNTFHYALNEKGLLLLGKSETTGVAENLFFPLEKNEKIYSKKPIPGRFMHITSERNEESMRNNNDSLKGNERIKDDFQKSADELLLSKYVPPGVVVNAQMEIVQFRGQTGKYLEPSPGKPSLSILKMVKEGLSFEIRNAIHKAKNSSQVFIKQGIPLNNSKDLVTVEVVPLPNTIEPHFLILFSDTVVAAPAKADKDKQGKTTRNSAQEVYIKKIEEELKQLREDMRNITEDQEAANEELQSANEELLSGSEELQSLNEELETSKEELQSTNEELVTVNQELFDRNELLNISRIYAEAIVNTVHEPLLVLDGNLKIKNANHSFYETFRITEKETLGKNLFSLQNEGWNIPGLRAQLLNLTTEHEQMMDWEMSHTFPTAGYRSIHFNAQPVQKENNENWILLALGDITTRKEIENINKRYSENLKKILENIPQITSTAAPDGSFTYFNKYFLNYSGLSFQEAITSGLEKVIHPDMLDEMKKRWTHSVQTGEDFRMELLLKRNNDQKYRWHLSNITPLRNEHGEITMWVGATADINEEKAKSDEKSEFIAVAGHELRTPLTMAKAYIQLLQQNFAGENSENSKFAGRIASAIDKLTDLVNELLDVSKIQHGKLALVIADFNIMDMLESVIESVQIDSSSHKIVLTGNIDHLVSGDQERLKQVVINLITNAVKYSPDKDKVQVHVAAQDGEIIVSVTDNGIGISKENIRKIFEMYFREKNSVLHLQGLGLGLSISSEIIARHKGRIWAESKPGKGSTFYFTIPQ